MVCHAGRRQGGSAVNSREGSRIAVQTAGDYLQSAQWFERRPSKAAHHGVGRERSAGDHKRHASSF